MTGSPIDASLRGTETPEQVQGAEVPDSKTNLAASPQLVMAPGVSRPAFKFEDGLGLTDAFGNIYDGYGGAGGSSITVRHIPPESLDETVDIADDLDLLQFDGTTEKWNPRTYIETQLMKLTNTITPADNDLAIFNSVSQFWEPVDRTELAAKIEIPLLQPSETVDEGDMLVANASGEFKSTAQVSPDFISAIIEVPRIRTYTFVQSLPYDITITGTVLSIATGSITVTFPSGTITAGNPVNVIVDTLGGGTNEFARLQINFTRNLLVT